MDICAADVSQAFLYDYFLQNVYTREGPEFGQEYKGKYLLIKKGLYGLRSSAASYHLHLSKFLYSLGFVPSYEDSDLWIKDCGIHYKYIATRVDDLLIASKDAKKIIQEIEDTYKLKGIGIPEYYLGMDVGSREINGQKYVATSDRIYIKRLIDKI